MAGSGSNSFSSSGGTARDQVAAVAIAAHAIGDSDEFGSVQEPATRDDPGTGDLSDLPQDALATTRWNRLVASLRLLVVNRSTPGFLISLILHTGILLLLAVWTISGIGQGGKATSIITSLNEVQAEHDLQVVDSALASGDVTDQAHSSAESALSAPPGLEPISAGAMGASLSNLASDQGVGGGAPAPRAQSAIGELIQSTSSSRNASLTQISVDGRRPESRQQLALQRGGSADSEAAVERALEWLAAHQRPNGSWSLVHTKAECGAYCTHPGSPERYEPAATGLALLAFLGAGYTHRDGKYAPVVNSGVYYLLQVMEETQTGGSFLHSHPQGMYNQGVATFALCEAYQLSKDESLRRPCQRAVEFIVSAQNDAGGWGYLPKRPGDLTITGWQTMALKSADGAEIYIPAQTIVRIDEFLDSQTDKEKIFYGYTAPGKSETCTAIGLLLRLFRNWPHSDPRVLAGVNYLEQQGISNHDIYRNYYATLLLYHVGGPAFTQWNERMRDSLVQTQSRTSHAAGSWYFDDKFGEVGGRLYTTAMAAMTLEVYYRFSPIYLNSDRPFEY